MKWPVCMITVLLAGCDVFGVGGACTLEPEFGIHVSVLDSVAGTVINSGKVTVVARDGVYVDSMSVVGNSHPILLVGERPGTYDLEVNAEGYAPWDKRGVKVSRGECHVKRVDVVARLTRSSALGERVHLLK